MGITEKVIIVAVGSDGKHHEFSHEYRLPRRMPVLGGLGQLAYVRLTQRQQWEAELIQQGFTIHSTTEIGVSHSTRRR